MTKHGIAAALGAFITLASLAVPAGAATTTSAQRVSPTSRHTVRHRRLRRHIVVLTEANSGSSLRTLVGGVITIRLQANPTTGYGWQICSPKGHLALLGSEYQPTPYPHSPGSPPRAGGGGHETFRFRAASAGVTNLQLCYGRPWLKHAAPASVFKLRVIARS